MQWLVSLAPCGLIEWVDATAQRMLVLRADIFESYTRERFEGELRQQSRVIKAETVSEAGRTLFWYDRRPA